MEQVSYRFAYVSGAFIPFSGPLLVMAANIGATQGVVRVLGFDRSKQIFDSMVDINNQAMIPYSTDGHVQPGEIWTYQYELSEARIAAPFRVVIQTTHDSLVPSIETIPFYVEGQAPTRTQMLCWPTNFVIVPLPPHPVAEIPVPPPLSGA
jgi:hypothetical protein